MQLLDFPTEILQRIIGDTLPYAFENVAVTCKPLHAVGAVFIEQHNKRRRRFRHFKFSCLNMSKVLRDFSEPPEEPEALRDYWDPATKATGIKITTVVQLLQHIAQDPIIAQYMQSVILQEEMNPDNTEHNHKYIYYDDPGKDFFPQLKGDFATCPVGALLRESTYLQEANIDPEDWWHEISEALIGHSEAFLLTLLPNVTEYAPKSAWGSNSYERDDVRTQDPRRLAIWPVLDIIVRRANDATEKDASLSKLEIFKPFRGTGYGNRAALSNCVPFLALESLREFYVGSCIFLQDGYTGLPFAPRYESYSKRLETIEMVGCIAQPKELGELLSRLPNLKKFRFAYETKWHGCGHNWDVGAFLAAIQTHCRDTLEELSVVTMNCYGSKGSTMTDMTHFKTLKRLELEFDMFLGPVYHPDTANAERPRSYTPAIPRLLEFLPRSIEEFRLYLTPGSEKHLHYLRDVFDGFQGDYLSTFPNLRNVTVVSVELDISDMLGTVQALEVVERVGGTVEYLPPGKCRPRFVDSFYTRFGVQAS